MRIRTNPIILKQELVKKKVKYDTYEKYSKLITLYFNRNSFRTIPKIKDLERNLSQANSETGKIALLINISSTYTNHNPKKSVHFAEEALLLSKKHQDKEAEIIEVYMF